MLNLDHLKGLARSTVKRASYRLGALDLYHRRRNRDGLTVLMFHRVIADTDPRWPSSNPEYTLSDRLFRRCLQFVKKHYSVIGLPELLEADMLRSRLPERPLLVTLDDGWADNEEYALAVLRDEGVRATLFVVSDTVGAPGLFWQELLYGAWRLGRLTKDECNRLWQGAGAQGTAPNSWKPPQSIQALITRLIGLDIGTRRALLCQLPDDLLHSERPFLATRDQIVRLASSSVDIGSHGRTHEPFDCVSDLEDELRGSRQALADLLPEGPGRLPETISFPHGRYTPETVQATREAGYKLAFTSHELINEPRAGRYSWLLGRTNVSTDSLSDATGRFRPDLLALWLFRGEHGFVDEHSHGLRDEQTRA